MRCPRLKRITQLAFLCTSLGAQADSTFWDKDSFSGKIEARAGGYLNHSTQTSNSMGQGLIRIQDTATKGDFALKAAPVYIFNSQDLGVVTQGTGHLDASEAWVDYTTTDIDLFAGRQPIKWGVSDGYGPTNFFKAYDISDPYFPRELTQNAIGMRLHPKSINKAVFELVYVPHATVDRLPFPLRRQSNVDTKHVRWGSAFPTAVDVNSTSTVPLRYAMEGQTQNSASDLGARLRLLQVHHWDYSLVIGSYRRKRPVLSYTIEGNAADPNLPLTVRFKPQFARSKMIGFDAAGAIGETGLRLEAAKSWVDKEDLAFGYDSLTINAGADHLFSDILNGDVYLNLSYVMIENRHYSEFVTNYLDLAFTQDYTTLRAEWRGSAWTFGNDLLMNVYGNYLNNLSMKYSHGPSLNFGVVGSFVRGEFQNGIGNFNDNHRVTFFLDYFI